MVNSVGQVGLPPYSTNTLGYQGSTLPYVPVVVANRDPTGADINYPTSCEWSNSVTLEGWKLFGFVDGVAQWRRATAGGTGIQSLSDDNGTKAFPDLAGDIKELGSAGIKTTAGTNQITFSLVGDGVAGQYYNVDAATPPGVNPVIPDGGGVLNFTGNQVAPLTVGADVIRTHTTAANSITWEIQQTDTAAAKDTSKNGVSHFNSAQFTADQGFISLVGGSVHPAFAGVDVDTHTAPGTDPVVANGSGLITVTGAQVAAGTVGANVLRSDSVAANTITMEVQRSSAQAAPTLAANGVAHFDSASFTVDADGFVQLASAANGITAVEVDDATAPGTNPVVPTVGGLMTVNGQIVSAGTVPVKTNSLAANTYDIQVQTTQSNATTDATRNGLAHFKTADFTVDANGFVQLANPPPDWPPFGPNLKDIPSFVIEDFNPPITQYAAKVNVANRINQVLDGSPSNFGYTYFAGHPGFMNVNTYGASGNYGIYWNLYSPSYINGALGDYILYSSDDFQLDFIAVIRGGVAFRIGLIQVAGSNPYSNGYFGAGLYSGLYYFTTNTTIGPTVTVNTGVLLDSNWHRFTISWNAGTQIATFYIDDVQVSTMSWPTGAIAVPGADWTSSSASNELLIDLMMYKQTPSVSRY